MGGRSSDPRLQSFRPSSFIERHSQAADSPDLAEFLSDWMVRFGQRSAKFHKCNRHMKPCYCPHDSDQKS
jgi:hypothetical protein